MAEIKVENLKYRYPDTEKLALDGITCDIKPGEFIGVIGRNGSGKSTFCQALLGLVPNFYRGAYGGKVFVDDVEVRNIEVDELCQKVGMVFQNPNDQIFKNTVLDEVMFGPLQIGMSKKQAKEVALKALDMVGLKGAEKINPYELGYRDAFLSPEEFVAYKKANA